MTNSQKDSYKKTINDLKQLLNKLENKIGNDKAYAYLCAKLAQMFANNYTKTETSGKDWGYFKYDGLCGFDFAINGSTAAKTSALTSIANPNTSLTGLSNVYQTSFAVGFTPDEYSVDWDALQIFFPGI